MPEPHAVHPLSLILNLALYRWYNPTSNSSCSILTEVETSYA
jgi:hypothetical protein